MQWLEVRHDHRRWGYRRRLWIIKVHWITGIIEYLRPSNFFGSLKSILSFEMTLRPSDHKRQCQFENSIISSDLNKACLLHKLYDEEKEKLDTYWLETFNPLLNGIKKLPLTVSQWSLVLPKCTLGWLCIARGVVIHESWKHRRTAENIGEQLRTSENI